MMTSRMDIIGQNGNDGLHYEETQMKTLDNLGNEPLFNRDSYKMYDQIMRELLVKQAKDKIALNIESVVVPGYN
jgi:DNA repair ATPase RecN